jgi:hypothetical protein
MRDELTAAIEQRKHVTFTYQGFPRRVQPAAFGLDVAGHETLHAYQLDGGSKRGKLPHWRNFHADAIEGLTVTDEVFGPNPPGFRSPFATTHASLAGGSATPDAPASKSDQAIPGLPITNEQAAKAVEVAEKALGKLGNWFKKR